MTSKLKDKFIRFPYMQFKASGKAGGLNNRWKVFTGRHL